MNILFSPLGMTDPIKYNHDGAMLHICRYYDIDTVYMYMSKEVCDHEDADHRFTYCLDQLAQLNGKKIACECIRKETLTDGVEKFDLFTEEFGNILADICSKMSEDDKLYLNISSGTPAMKATLQYLVTVLDHPMTPVQVYTPERKANTKFEQREGFDRELEWEYNEDNSNGINRCSISDIKNYGARVQKKMVAALLDKYDYIGAWELAKTIRTNLSDKAFDIITAAKDRYMLDFRSAKTLFDKYSIEAIDIVNAEYIAICESILRLGLMCRKKEYLDFLRGVTPVIWELFRIVLKKCGVDLNNYCTTIKKYNPNDKKPDQKQLMWDREKIKQNQRLFDTLNSMGREYDGKDVYSSTMVEIIREFADSDQIISQCSKLRSVDGLRNIAAHQIVYISEDKIRAGTKNINLNPTGSMPDEIVDSMIDLLRRSGVNLRNDFLDSYDKMNRYILDCLYDTV